MYYMYLGTVIVSGLQWGFQNRVPSVKPVFGGTCIDFIYTR